MACVMIYDYINSGKFNPEDSPYLVYPSEDEDAASRETKK